MRRSKTWIVLLISILCAYYSYWKTIRCISTYSMQNNERKYMKKSTRTNFLRHRKSWMYITLNFMTLNVFIALLCSLMSSLKSFRVYLLFSELFARVSQLAKYFSPRQFPRNNFPRNIPQISPSSENCRNFLAYTRSSFITGDYQDVEQLEFPTCKKNNTPRKKKKLIQNVRIYLTRRNSC